MDVIEAVKGSEWGLQIIQSVCLWVFSWANITNLAAHALSSFYFFLLLHLLRNEATHTAAVHNCVELRNDVNHLVQDVILQ